MSWIGRYAVAVVCAPTTFVVKFVVGSTTSKCSCVHPY
jgi:hypothetical protein